MLLYQYLFLCRKILTIFFEKFKNKMFLDWNNGTMIQT